MQIYKLFIDTYTSKLCRDILTNYLYTYIDDIQIDTHTHTHTLIHYLSTHIYELLIYTY